MANNLVEFSKIDIKISEEGRRVAVSVNGKEVPVCSCSIKFGVDHSPSVVLDFVAPGLSIDGEFTSRVEVRTIEESGF